MSGQLLVGAGKDIRAIPDDPFRRAMEGIPGRMSKRLAFLTPEHHAVRDLVVREMPRQRRPIAPRQIAAMTGIAVARVNAILDELERNLFFLVRNSRGSVAWAFPVTVARTPHHLTFSTGEHTSGA